MADTTGAPPTTNGGSLLETTKANAAAAYNTVTTGPVAQNVKGEADKTTSEFSNLASARRTPSDTAATGQPLTHYHSFFHELLSWNNPRASAIALASIITAIFAARYIDVTRYVLKASCIALAITVTAEGVGNFLLNKGLATQVRPRRYFTISRETVDAAASDVHELINFVVIETQRILFVENIAVSALALIGSFLTYHLIKIVPYWGMAVISTLVTFIAPLVYVTNKELIDDQLKNVSDILGAQTAQVRNVAQAQVEQVATISKQYAGDYTGKVQELLGKSGGPPKYTEKKTEFPTAPLDEPKTAAQTELPEVPQEDVIGGTAPPLAS